MDASVLIISTSCFLLGKQDLKHFDAGIYSLLVNAMCLLFTKSKFLQIVEPYCINVEALNSHSMVSGIQNKKYENFS